MGHVLFVILHVVAVLFGVVWLFVTIPLHLIYGVSSRGKATPAVAVDAPTPSTHVRCPECRELVRADALKCKHCGIKLIPVVDRVPEPKTAAQERKERLLIGAILVVLILVLWNTQQLR